MSNNVLLPLSEMLEKVGATKSNLLYLFKQNENLARQFLVVKTVTFSNGKTGKRYYVRYSFIKYYFDNIDRTCTEEDIRLYEEAYYAYVEQEEKKLADTGKSIATEQELWKDMEIIDANLSKKSLKYMREKTGKKTTSYDRREIADIVYRHIFCKKRYFDIVMETLREELAQ